MRILRDVCHAANPLTPRPAWQRYLVVVSLLGLASCSGSSVVRPLTATEAQAEQESEAKRLGIPVTIKNEIGMEFSLIPRGDFTMGSPKNQKGHQPAEVQHKVTLTRSLYMATTEVTQAQWMQLMDENPSFVEGDNYPVETITWDEAVEFCRRLSEKDGARYRLPTEAEWEYACRAGTNTAFHTGESLSSKEANFNGEKDDPQQGIYRDETTPVGGFAPNAWGLVDMHGNVWEWCADWHADYPKGAAIDPQGPTEGTTRIVRGGCWVNPSAVCRSANRGSTEPVSWNFHFGMRVVREID
ncbi:MAG: formylglycine-generating enzyme family protein [Planctomycetales bacterium]|nr:formylglycine-generating enzyme family protein [Planctomycetales bacterium]